MSWLHKGLVWAVVLLPLALTVAACENAREEVGKAAEEVFD